MMDVLALKILTALRATANLVCVLHPALILLLLMEASQLDFILQDVSVLETKSVSRTSVSNRPVLLTALPNWVQLRLTVVLV